MSEDIERRQFLLRQHMMLSVPWAAYQLKDEEPDRLAEMAPELGQLIAERGDDIQFGAPKAGETARLVGALARGLAILSYCPGGVEFLGVRYVSERGKGCTTSAKTTA